ncbi:MAG: sulfotransferase family protein, partial [Pseudomonadota bacterium]
TAFEWMMRQRGDLTCFHEPFGMAWYQGPEARAPRPAPEAKRRPRATFARVWEDIQSAAQTQPVFVKDMPHHTDHLWDEAFLDRITHSFLIRQPVKVLASLERSYKKAGMQEGFEPHEISFAPQQALFDILRQRGQTPPVLDSDDLLEDPETMVRAYCDAIGIPFLRHALSWDPGARDDVLWYDGNDEIWHASLRDSDGLKPIPRQPKDPGDLPAELAALHDRFQPHYNALHAHRLRPQMVTG